MKANNGRGFARVADAVGMGGTNRVASRTSQFMSDIMMKTSFRRSIEICRMRASAVPLTVYHVRHVCPWHQADIMSVSLHVCS